MLLYRTFLLLALLATKLYMEDVYIQADKQTLTAKKLFLKES